MLKIKVCGMRQSQNINELLTLQPDYIGFIFYEKSKRDATQILDKNIVSHIIKPSTQKIGVFVDGDIDFIANKIKQYSLAGLQLHGNESVEYIEELKKKIGSSTLTFIKAFSVDENFDFSILEKYENVVDYFLFDTKGKNHGGNGIKFDWKIIENNPINKPFFISGGIGIEDLEEVKLLSSKVKNLYAVDVNSKFEIEPGLKDINMLSEFISSLRNGKKVN